MEVIDVDTDLDLIALKVRWTFCMSVIVWLYTDLQDGHTIIIYGFWSLECLWFLKKWELPQYQNLLGDLLIICHWRFVYFFFLQSNSSYSSTSVTSTVTSSVTTSSFTSSQPPFDATEPRPAHSIATTVHTQPMSTAQQGKHNLWTI